MLYRNLPPTKMSSEVVEYFLVAFDCEPNKPDELALNAGEELLILDRSDPDWWKGKNQNGQEGLFPSNYGEIVYRTKRAPPGSPVQSRTLSQSSTYQGIWFYQMLLHQKSPLLFISTITFFCFSRELVIKNARRAEESSGEAQNTTPCNCHPSTGY